MAETPKTQLELQIEQEFRELHGPNAPPKVPLGRFMGGYAGPMARCHISGHVVPIVNLTEFDTHVPKARPRLACPNCHPHRGQHAG